MADHDITIGELHRNQERLERRLNDAIENTVGQREYKADQVASNQRFQDLGREIGGVRAGIASVDTKHDADIKEVRGEIGGVEDKQEAYEKEQRASKSKWIVVWAGLIAGPIIATIVGILFRGAMTQP